MKIVSAQFERCAFSPKDFPKPDLPEIAFAGRSNVGKSSLINTLVHRKHLVKVSSTPGKTKSINFFNINGKVRFIDLPGYGYAHVPTRVQESWKPLIESYLTARPVLVLVVFIMDIRRDVGKGDLMLWEWLHHANKEIVPVCTKADKIPFGEIRERMAHLSVFLQAEAPLIPFSSRTGMGKDEVWSRIYKGIQSSYGPGAPRASVMK
jgi:GTP-binding protein